MAGGASCANLALLYSHPKLASELRDIRYSSSVTVSLVYNEKARASLPEGFGYLAPRTEGKRVLAATFVHNKFPRRTPDDRALIRCFLGELETWRFSIYRRVKSYVSFGQNSVRFSALKPNRFLRAFINGKRQWRNIMSAISKGWNRSNDYA